MHTYKGKSRVAICPSLPSTTCSMDSLPEFSPYLFSNTALPDELKPTLGAYLTQISGCIAELAAEIDQLERALDVKRQKKAQYMRAYERHLQLQAPIRSIPAEILGLIFGLTLGDEPFDRREYQTYGYIREVCTSWRDVLATTPDLCKGLVVDLDGPLTNATYTDEGDIRAIQHNLKPWLAIVSQNHPYHLVLGAEDEDNVADSEDHIPGIYEWIFTTIPTPRILSINNSNIFSAVYSLVPRDNQISHLTLDFWQDADLEVFEVTPFQKVFPCLKSLFIDSPIEFLSPMRHSNLQSLTLCQIYGSSRAFSHFLLDFPSLQELRICAEELCDPQEDPANTSEPLIHPKLEILVAEGEDLALLLKHVTFPSLKFLGLKAWGANEDYGFPVFLQRCSLDNKGFTVSIKGSPSKPMFNLLIRNVPRGARLHLDVLVDDDENEDYAGEEAHSIQPASAQAPMTIRQEASRSNCTCQRESRTRQRLKRTVASCKFGGMQSRNSRWMLIGSYFFHHFPI
ncbi:hypothetical protein BKA70DRAFT_1272418 [Coprinopsis sp. MPI-PUGE-AT-0042]|nr:hypothetical protein BKA70DRAFT_1272418 [Coprinopsis sp. MPI-PUGE-AT-0042]